MAGAIIISENNGLSLNSLDFDYIIQKIRESFVEEEYSIRDEIYSPIDEGGMSFVSLRDRSDKEFEAFSRAAQLAYDKEVKENPMSDRKASWDALMSALRSELR
jgi:hypothetical protein